MGRQSLIVGVAVALLSVTLAILLRFAIDPIVGSRYPVALVFVAVLISAGFFGSGSGLTAAIVGVMASSFFILPPRGQVIGQDGAHYVGLLLNLTIGISIALLGGSLRSARQRAGRVRESEGRYRTLFEYAPDGIITADRSGQCLDANASMCRMLGYQREQLDGVHVAELVAEDSRAAVGPVLMSLSENIDHHAEWRLRRRDGSIFIADVIATVMPDSTFVAVVRDMSERNATTEALRIAEERVRFALESAHVGIWDMDYQSGALRWSPVLEAQYGFPVGTFPGTLEAYSERVHPDDRQDLQDAIQRAVHSGEDFAVQHRSLSPNGTIRWLRGAGRIRLGPDGKPVRGLGVSIDVSDQHRLEEQYRHSQKMDAIGRLAGGIAHDFNNLLTVILGYCELVLSDADSFDPHRHDIVEIQSAGTRAAALTAQLLAFSRKQFVRRRILDLNSIVSEMSSMLRRLLGEDIECVVNLQNGLGAVKADRAQLEQVLLNLAVNARDAMPAGGTLRIETSDVELDEHYPKTHLGVTPGPYVALTISDTGVGMTPEVQARLFEPFFTTKEVGKGTGLGLATVHGIVAANGGTINVYSEMGRGTSFKVCFPRADAGEVVDDAAPPQTTRRISGVTVLVVEDAEGLRDLTRRLLERHGCTVFVAADAEEALIVFDGRREIDLLLTDVVMPGTSGPELARKLWERRPALKVIYMSGYTEDAIVHRTMRTPGVAFLQKPFSADGLTRKISEVMERT